MSPIRRDRTQAPSAFQEKIKKWHEEEQYQQIIDAIEALPQTQQTPDLISQLARAYNNLASPEDRDLFEKAAALLKSVEDQFVQDHDWNFRMGYALYYLDQELKARSYFEKALELRPGDEDTQSLIQQCSRSLTLPNSMKPFSERTREGWESFLDGEAGLRAMIDDRKDGEAVVERCHQLLAPAFYRPFFEIGFNGDKYDLILSPDGDRSRLFKLVYFKNHAPEKVFDHWNILIGRQPAKGFELRMYDRTIGLSDARVWVEELKDKQLGLSIYCEKLLPLVKKNENQAYGLMTVLLDQAIGEIPAIRYIGYMDLLEEPGQGEEFCLNELMEYISRDRELVTADELCTWYSAYEMTPSGEEDWSLREDVFAGVTSCLPIPRAYYQGDDEIMEDFHMDGAVPGFFWYPLDGIARDQILDLRDEMEQKISAKAGDAVTFTGGATGVSLGYLDFIAWNLDQVLQAALEVLGNVPVKEAFFHTYRRNVGSICLKKEET
ncbi:hypothetical protein [Enterocloster citroniae]